MNNDLKHCVGKDKTLGLKGERDIWKSHQMEHLGNWVIYKEVIVIIIYGDKLWHTAMA